jgi:hypothetical protein
MKQNEIIEMARQAGLHVATDVNWMPIIGLEYAEKLIALARTDEREACAKVCDSFYESWINIHGRYEFMGEGAQECAEAIRARGQA